MTDISVVIPTYNRAAALAQCLGSLQAQTLDRGRYEVIVVDDASTDTTAAVLQQVEGVRAFVQPRNAGPAAARNAGIRAARGRYILFLDDDVVSSSSLLAQHVSAHQEREREDVAILGKASWPPEEPLSPLTRYVFSGAGAGSVYERIGDPNDVSYKWFNTCHVSISRSFLLQHGLFDEDFVHAYGEDTELAYRLQRQGLRIVYRSDIVVRHYHPRSYLQFRQQRRHAGAVTQLMARKHPELADLSFLNLSRKSRIANWIKRRGTEMLLDPVLDWSDRRQLDHPWLDRTFGWALNAHQTWALADAVRRSGGDPAA